jgi:hypothetical protein
MWIPSSAAELEAAVAAGTVYEGPHLDAKVQLPAKNEELAKDIAAMTVEGGVIIIGVGEDTAGRLALIRPQPLKGMKEKIDQIAQTSIAEVPRVEIRELPQAAAGDVGYIVIVIAPSALAPHQVTVGGDLRFYGRGATGNRRLTEGEIARLYERRAQWNLAREDILEDDVSQPLFPSTSDLGYLFAFARPVAASQPLLEVAASGNELSYLQQQLDGFRGRSGSSSFTPSLRDAPIWHRRGATGWMTSSSPTAEEQGQAGYVAHFEIDLDGTTHLFFGRAAERYDGGLVCFREGVVEAVTDFVRLSAMLWEGARVMGPVDIGVAVTGIYGSVALELRGAYRAPRFSEQDFRATTRMDMSDLVSAPEQSVRMLMRRFLHAMGDTST